MPHTIEIAKSGRSRCRKCKQGIAKGELRFGEETASAFGEGGAMTYLWYHLRCAAEQRPKFLEAALAGYPGEVPGRSDLEALLRAPGAPQKPSAFPYAERAPSGRSKCLACEEVIEKGSLRVAVEREVDTGSFVTRGAGYLHPACALDYADDEQLVERIRANSTSLSAEELEALMAELH